jgi:hypothetical protein
MLLALTGADKRGDVLLKHKLHTPREARGPRVAQRRDANKALSKLPEGELCTGFMQR